MGALMKDGPCVPRGAGEEPRADASLIGLVRASRDMDQTVSKSADLLETSSGFDVPRHGCLIRRREILPDKRRSISRFHRSPETRLPWLTGQLPLLLSRPQTWTTATPRRIKRIALFGGSPLRGGPITVTPLTACWRKHAAGSTYTVLLSSGGWKRKRMCF